MVESVSDPVTQLLAEMHASEGLSLSAAGRLFPGHRGGTAVDPSTVYRWISKGSKSIDGRRVKLAAVRVGGRWLTTRGAVERFVTALTAAVDATPATPPPRPPAARQRASEAAGKQLKDAGW